MSGPRPRRWRLADPIDLALSLLKWPVALAALALLPGAARALRVPARAALAAPGEVAPFLAGLAGYLTLWWFALSRRSFGSFVSTLEHELTHGLFALLTLHRVVGLRATWNQGGELRYVGRGNWLISIAPYFCPTASLLLIPAFFLAPPGSRAGLSLALGVTVAYHLTSTIRETHRGQHDLLEVGFPFACAFLPTANLLAFGLLLAFAAGGAPLARAHLADVAATTEALARALHAAARAGS